MTEYWIEVFDRGRGMLAMNMSTPIKVLGPFNNRQDASDAQVPYMKVWYDTFLYTKENNEKEKNNNE